MDQNKVKDIIEGFDQDIEEMAQTFPAKYPQLRLANFFAFWNEGSMDCIFANRFDPRELLEAIVEMNERLVNLIIEKISEDHCDNNKLLISLYMIFSLAIKQPERLRRKVRLTSHDVAQIHDWVVTGSFTDAKYVWKSLFKMDVVDIVEERTIFGPSMLTGKGIQVEPQSSARSQFTDEISESLKFIHEKIEPALIKVQSLSQPYEQIKESLRLDDYRDPTVEIKSEGTIGEFIDQARVLLSGFIEDAHGEMN